MPHSKNRILSRASAVDIEDFRRHHLPPVILAAAAIGRAGVADPALASDMLDEFVTRRDAANPAALRFAQAVLAFVSPKGAEAADTSHHLT